MAGKEKEAAEAAPSVATPSESQPRAAKTKAAEASLVAEAAYANRMQFYDCTFNECEFHSTVPAPRATPNGPPGGTVGRAIPKPPPPVFRPSPEEARRPEVEVTAARPTPQEEVAAALQTLNDHGVFTEQ